MMSLLWFVIRPPPADQDGRRSACPAASGSLARNRNSGQMERFSAMPAGKLPNASQRIQARQLTIDALCINVAHTLHAIEELTLELVAGQRQLGVAAREADLTRIDRAPVLELDADAIGEREHRLDRARGV